MALVGRSRPASSPVATCRPAAPGSGSTRAAASAWSRTIANGAQPRRPRLRAADSCRASSPSRASAATSLDRLEPAADDYAGFNLLLGDGEQLIYASNRAERFARASSSPACYGLSNHLLDTPWPKLQRVRVRAGLDPARSPGSPTPRRCARHAAGIFADRRPATAAARAGLRPDAGLGARPVGALRAQHRDYGTRCTTVLLIGHDGSLCGHERRFDSAGRAAGEREWRLNGTTWQRPATESEPGNPFREPLL